MRKYEFIIGDIRKQFVIDKVKYVNISNNKDYWFYKRCIRFYTNKIEKTELFIEENNRIQILIDGKELTRHDELIIIDHSFDFEDDLKCGSKSLTLRYLQSLILSKSLCDEMQQMNSFLALVSSMLSSEEYYFEAVELNQKTLPKLLLPFAVIDGDVVNSLDLSYEEMIARQVFLAKNSLSDSKRSIIFIEVIELNEELKEIIESIEIVDVIVLFSKLTIDVNEKMFIGGLDLEDEETLYERMVHMTNYLNLEEYKKHIIKEHSKLLIK